MRNHVPMTYEVESVEGRLGFSTYDTKPLIEGSSGAFSAKVCVSEANAPTREDLAFGKERKRKESSSARASDESHRGETRVSLHSEMMRAQVRRIERNVLQPDSSRALLQRRLGLRADRPRFSDDDKRRSPRRAVSSAGLSGSALLEKKKEKRNHVRKQSPRHSWSKGYVSSGWAASGTGTGSARSSVQPRYRLRILREVF